MTLIQIAFATFLAVAAGGILMTFLIAAKARIPSLLSNGHGLAGLCALAFLFVVNLRTEETNPERAWWALGVFTAGFIGGLLLFRIIFKGRATLPLVAMHASVAAVGLYLLYGVAF